MLTILRTNPAGSTITAFMDISITIRDENNNNIEGCPDITFFIRTYKKVSNYKENVGDQIVLPINLFFKTLSLKDHRVIYELYRYAKIVISRMDFDNRRKVHDELQMKIDLTIKKLNLDEKMIAFCGTSIFEYPDFGYAGQSPHHSAEKTFDPGQYIEVTGMSILSKMMLPIWGELINTLGEIGIHPGQREKLAFDLIEPTLEETAFSRIYSELSYVLTSRIVEVRKEIDKKPMGNAKTSFILTHSGIDDDMFDCLVMSTIVVKRMATYECFTRLRDNTVPPNVMVYIDDGIRRTADTRIKEMRKDTSVMPRKELPNFNDDDNTSILDHSSKASSKPFDVPIFITVGVANWEIPKILEETQTPMDIYNQCVEYYTKNPFDISPLTQATVASFVGTRFGGSKCINYLPPLIYQKIIIILQIYLINQGMVDLAQLISAINSTDPLDGGNSNIGTRLMANIKTNEYHKLCQSLFKGFLEKPVVSLNKKKSSKKLEVDRIDFVSHIEKMADWMIMHSHLENMAPPLWTLTDVVIPPPLGKECIFDSNIIKNLCKFYLLQHQGSRPI